MHAVPLLVLIASVAASTMHFSDGSYARFDQVRACFVQSDICVIQKHMFD